MSENSNILIRSGRALGDALKEIRTQQGLTQQDMAERLNAHRTTIVDLESGNSKQLDRLARFIRFSGYDIILVPRQNRDTSPGA